jgi:hypothetical protein
MALVIFQNLSHHNFVVTASVTVAKGTAPASSVILPVILLEFWQNAYEKNRNNTARSKARFLMVSCFKS